MKHQVNTRGFIWGLLDRTSDANLVTKARVTGGIANWILLHSINSFSFNALMSCSMESSRTESSDIVVATNTITPATVPKLNQPRGDINPGQHPVSRSPTSIAPHVRVGHNCVARRSPLTMAGRESATDFRDLPLQERGSGRSPLRLMVRTTGPRSEHVYH